MTRADAAGPVEPLKSEAEETSQALAAALRGLRNQTPLTLRALSQRTHVSASMLCRYFNGQSLPSLPMVEALAELCEGDVDELSGLWHRADAARTRLKSAPATAMPGAVLAKPTELPPGPARSRRSTRVLRTVAAVAGVALCMTVTGLVVRHLTLGSLSHESPDATLPLQVRVLDNGAGSSPSANASVTPSRPPSPSAVSPSGGNAPLPVPASPRARAAPQVPAAPPRSAAPGPVVPAASCQFSGSSRVTILDVEAFSVQPGGTLKAGQTCQIGKARLVMQQDGDLVLFAAGKKAWAASTGNPEVVGSGQSAVFQTDQNLVLHSASGEVKWTTGTTYDCCGRLAIQSDGNVVIYSGTGIVLWATNTDRP